MTAAKFIELVLRKLGVIGMGESGAPEEIAEAKTLIDAAMKSLHVDGLLWWAVKVDDVTFASATAARPVDCLECVYASWNGVPVRLAERLEYERIEEKSRTGNPEIVIDDGANLTLWPVPGAGDLRLTYQRDLLNLVAGNDIDMPERLVFPLINYMAYQLAPWYDPPQEKAQRITVDGQAAFLTLRRGSVQTAEQPPTTAEYF
jgi:hypothetical protein